MGASQSKSDAEDNVFYSETPIEFSQDVINHLADNMASPDPSPERQSSIDEHIRSRIQVELEHLRQEEEVVRQEIERALEKENLDKERELAGEESASEDEHGVAGVKSSTAIAGDLEEVRQKVERFQSKRALSEFPEVEAKGEAVVLCYQSHPTNPLDCWREVSEFKSAVSQVEQHYIDSLRV